MLLPTGSVDISQVAVPSATGWAVQPVIGSPFSVNPTVPAFGIAVAGESAETVAVNVTVSPNVEVPSLDATVVVVPAWSTSKPSVVDVLVRKSTFPEYTAVTEWFATGSVVSQVATPLVSGRVPQPEMVELPSLNSTVPAGVPLSDVTVAVRVDGCEKTAGLGVPASSVEVVAWLTTWKYGGDTLARNLASPLNSAVICGAPVGESPVVHWAWPEATVTSWQPVIGESFALKSTVPLPGVAVAGDTALMVAV